MTKKDGKKGIELIKDIVLNGTIAEKLELFGFDANTPRDIIRKKFKIFTRGCYPRYFREKSAEFHDDFIYDMIKSYFGDNHLIAAFRGSAKTSLKKLFDVFVLLNDRSAYRKYLKVLSEDKKNSKAIVTDVYNLIVEVGHIYGNPFENDGKIKREETMEGFVTKDGRKYSCGTVGQSQRGHVQDAYRPDWVWFEDIENSKTVKSAVITEGIVSRCNEAIDGLSLNGSYFVTCNYISDMGTVQSFMNKPSVKTRIVPLLLDDEDNTSVTWKVYTPEKVEQIRKDAKETDNFFTEFQCDPQRAENKFFDIDRINRDIKNCKDPIRTSAGVHYWSNYVPHHRFGMGSDHSDGVGLDANTMSLFDFTTGELAASYANNEISADLSAFEFARVGSEYGNCIWAPEINNKCGGTVITTAKSIPYPNLYQHVDETKSKNQRTTKIGWETNSKTKYNMFFEFRRDYNDGHIKIYDKRLLAEMKAYTNNDLKEEQAGLITRHFDLLTSCFVAGTMVKTKTGNKPIQEIKPGELVLTRGGYKKVLKTSSRIKKVITNIGLTGTENHPVFFNKNEIKKLSCINNSDKLYIWNEKLKKIERLSYIEALPIIDTLIQKSDRTGYTLWEGLSGKCQQNICIGKFGKIISELYQMVLLFITKTIIQIITVLKIFVPSQEKSMRNFTCLIQKGSRKLGGLWIKIVRKLTKELEDILKIKNLKNLNAKSVESIFFLNHIIPCFAVKNVNMNQNIEGEEKNKFTEFVQFADKASGQVIRIKNIVQKNALTSEEENTYQRVYNIEVEDFHEYFANNILVHNCVIAWQMRKYAVQQTGNYNKAYENYLASAG